MHAFCSPWTLALLTVVVMVLTTLASGSPCTDNSHNCQADSQRCVERNNSAGFTCQCVQPDQQLDYQNNCTDIPDSQRLYVAMPINMTGGDILRLFEILNNISITEETLKEMYRTLTIPSFKGVKFIEYRKQPVPDLTISVHTLLFTDNITVEIRQAVAQTILLLEQARIIYINNITVNIDGNTGIFDTEEDSLGDVDAVDWCSSPSLYSCRDNSHCHDFGLRYDCPCNAGFVDDGHSCYECHDDFHYGPNCAQPCACVINNTRSCDHINGTCFCKEPWEGVTCDTDTDECAKDPGICGDPFTRCVNTDGGYECVCSDTAVYDAASGDCIGAIISGPSPFDTDGSRDLHLHCVASNETEVTQYTWSDVCLQEAGSRCTIRPQPPWDDGKNITCTVMYRNGRSTYATFVVNLNYPPPSSPVIEGYVTSQAMRAGETLEMTCSVNGGKPLVTSVTFSCPRHPDRTPDVIEDSGVTSVLEMKLTSSDDGALCRCSALWKSGSRYPQSSTSILVVKGTAEAGATEASDNVDLRWYIMFGVLGFLVLVLIIVVLVIFRLRVSNSRDGNDSPSTDVSSAGTAASGMGNTLTGMRPPESQIAELRPLDQGQNVAMEDLRALQEPRQHVWRPLPVPKGDVWDTAGTERDRVIAENETYDRIEPTVHPELLDGRRGLDLYLHPVSPSQL